MDQAQPESPSPEKVRKLTKTVSTACIRYSNNLKLDREAKALLRKLESTANALEEFGPNYPPSHESESHSTKRPGGPPPLALPKRLKAHTLSKDDLRWPAKSPGGPGTRS